MSEVKNIPDGWEETTIGKVSNVQSGSTPSTKNEEFWNGKIPWITPKDLSNHNEVFIKNGERNITELGLKNSSAQTLPKNTILFTSRAPIGYIAISENEVTTNQGFKNIICDEIKSHYKYFYYLMKYKTDFIEKNSSGSTFSEASGSLIKSIEINLPPLPEQKAIASILTSFDNKIELLQQENKTLETLAQTIFKEWFGKYQINSELPEGWCIGKLDEIANHIKQNIKPFNEPDKLYYHFSLPAYDDGLKPVAECGKEIKSNKYAVIENSFLVSKLNPFTPRIWTINESQENNICSTEFQVVKPKKELSFSLIHCFLNSEYFTSELSQKVQGTSSSHQRVRPQDIFDVELVIPNKKSLLEFHNLINPLISKKNINYNQIQSLIKTRDELLPRLMSGQVRVKM